MPPGLQTIDDVIRSLDAIIDLCHDRGSRLGYFPAMYRKTTLQVKEGLETGRFNDPDRLERLDVVFAERYLDAFRVHERGGRPTGAWAYAFEMGSSHRPSVIQHLLLGMNAHINLDLAISAVDVAPGPALASLKHDFDEINDILGELVDRIQEDLSSIFPFLRALDFLCFRLDEAAVHLAVRRARASAWRNAVRLSALPTPDHRSLQIVLIDRDVVSLAETICPPGDPEARLPRIPAPEVEPGDVATVRRIIEALTDG